MYEREYIVSHDIQGIAVALGVGVAFVSIALFAPGGILESGLFSMMIIFFLLGLLVLVAGVIAICGTIKEKIFSKNTIGHSTTKIVVQAEPDAWITLVLGFAFAGMGSLFACVGLFVPEGVMNYGMSSELLIMVVFGGSFALIGIGQFLSGIPHFKASLIYKSLYKNNNSFTTTATYFEEPEVESNTNLPQNTSISSHNKPLLYKYQDETGVLRISEDPEKLTEEQRAWFQERGTFTIRCKGKYSVIMEYPNIEYKDSMNNY